MNQYELTQTAKTKFQKISHHLDSRLKELHEQGAITRLDYQKMKSDALQSGQAVLNAIQNTSYPPEMQQELVASLIAQFEVSTAKILQDAELRLFEPSNLIKNMSAIDTRIASDIGTHALTWLRSSPPEIERLHKDFLQTVKTAKRQSNELTINDVYTSYERSSHLLFQQVTLKLTEANPAPSNEPIVRITERDIWEADKGNAKRSQGQGFIDKLFRRGEDQ